MIDLSVKPSQIKRIEAALGSKAKQVPRKVASAVNKTATRTKGFMAKEVSKELALTQKNIKSTISIPERATPNNLGVKIVLRESKKIPLRDYGARQTKRGVSYKISRRGSRKLVEKGFQGPTPNIRKVSWRGRVFARVGESRLPIVQLYGPSPWGAFNKNKMRRPVLKLAKKQLRKELAEQVRRIKLNV